jgi:hypothetical protein
MVRSITHLLTTEPCWHSTRYGRIYTTFPEGKHILGTAPRLYTTKRRGGQTDPQTDKQFLKMSCEHPRCTICTSLKLCKGGRACSSPESGSQNPSVLCKYLKQGPKQSEMLPSLVLLISEAHASVRGFHTQSLRLNRLASAIHLCSCDPPSLPAPIDTAALSAKAVTPTAADITSWDCRRGAAGPSYD